MSTLSRASMTALQKDINAAMVAIGAKHGFAINTNGGSIGQESATLRLLVVPTAADAQPGVSAFAAKAEKDWTPASCAAFGLKHEWLGKTLKHRSLMVTIIGLQATRIKYPVAVRNSNGKEFLITADEAIRALGSPAQRGMAIGSTLRNMLEA